MLHVMKCQPPVPLRFTYAGNGGGHDDALANNPRHPVGAAHKQAMTPIGLLNQECKLTHVGP
jgi:hypothetical protein